MAKDKKTNSELIIDALLTGKSLRLSEITAMLSEFSGKNVKIQDISSILSKLSNNSKCELGYLMQKQKTDKGYVYHLVKEALEMSPEQVYDLSRKSGKNRFTWQDAVKKYPGLKKYAKPPRSKPAAQPKDKSTMTQTSSARPEQAENADEVLKKVAAELVNTFIGQGGLKINVNLNVNFKSSRSQ